MTIVLAMQLFTTLFGAGTAALAISMGATSVAYVWYFLYRRNLWKAIRQNWLLAAFVIQGLVWCLLSLAGLAGWFTLRREFGVDMSYLPRQAYYLFFLPVIAAAPYFGDNERCMEILRRYGRWAVPVLMGLKLIATGDIGLNNNQLLWLGILALWCGEYKLLDVTNFCLLLVGAYFSEQTATLILGVVFAGAWLLRRWKILRLIGTLTFPVVLAVSFLLPQVDGMIDRLWALDANTGWRLEFWEDEATAIADTYGVGIGYGTTYASYEFAEPQSETFYNPVEGRYGETPFSQNGEYTKEQRPFVTANHNSFVSVAFRLGIPGLLLFVGALVALWKKIFCFNGRESGALIYAFCGSMLLISTNVGLESPSYLLPNLGAWCLVMARLCTGQKNVEKM
ncbi:O-antigen ligase family protein [Candidatus Allofournierella merdipullorum]|uniref:O-antigen ligase family protein n=1 Tax=Candidatus Allofournierella merdipullorum TaxID=2838595 RepID=UPI002A8AF5C7|nr:O-antigen ligase family protein [Candidatus Fournierella merdipullorum]